MKLKIIFSIFTSILIFTTLFTSGALAQSQTSERVPSIQVTSLGQYRGQYLSLIFVEANNSPVTFDPFRIDVRVIKVKPQQLKIEGNEVQFTASDIPKRPFKFAYNFLLIVVSPYADFSWVNSDGSRPLPIEWHTTNITKNFFKAIPRSNLNYGDGNGVLKISIAE